ncbi:MAG: DUF4136 domain-containing protein [Pricia sp.]
MKTFKNTLLGLFAITFLISCGPKVTTSKPSDVDLTKYETFAYLPNGNFEDPNKGYDDPSIGEAVINEVNNSMKELGYELERDQPDLLLLMGTKTDTDVEKTTDPVYATYPNYYGTGYRVGTYYDPYYYRGYNAYNNIVGYDTDYERTETGTLMLSLVDRETRNVVWRGTASNFVGGERNTQAISDFVDDLFAEYPAEKNDNSMR